MVKFCVPTWSIFAGPVTFLNQVHARFLKIDPVQIVGIRACVCVCLSVPEAINN